MKDLAELERIRTAAETLLKALGQAGSEDLVRTLKPRDDDYARVFIGDAAVVARAGYAQFWHAPPPALAREDQTNVLVIVAPAENLTTENALSREFPGGYRKVAHTFQPGLVWVRFTYAVPGATSGMSYDGLVYLDDHWAWFPKPWRVLAERRPSDN